MNLKNLYIHFAYILIIILSVYSYKQLTGHNQNKEDQLFTSSDVVTAKVTDFGKPVRLNIPGIGIDIGVIDGSYSTENNTWNVSDTFAQYATISRLPNAEQGSTVIYGHNTKNIFGKINKMTPGDTLYLYTDTNYLVEYQYTSNKVVTPTDVSLFKYEGEPRLNLITCTGLLNEKRLILDFKVGKISKI